MLRGEDITARLGKQEVLHGVRLDAAPGGITAIVGPNGSGKTTLLRRLTGDLPGGGRISLEGVDPVRTNPRTLALRRGVLPQSTRLAFPFTLTEVVRMGLEAGHAAHRPGIVQAAIAEVGLTAKAHGLFQDMSGGEQARGHLARVRAQIWEPIFETRPTWLFVDEPVAALDIGHQLQVMRLLRSFADAGGGVIAVMHDLNLTAMFADSMILMEAGRIVAHGPPREVMTDPLLSRAYRCRLCVNSAPTDAVWLLPQAAGL